MCYNEGTPFRCINGDCKSSPEECELIQRLGSVKNITYSFNKYNKIDFSFAYDTNRRPIAKIQIPGSGLKFDGNYSKLYIREIASSILYKSEFYNNTAEFLYNISNSIYGSEGVLNFENSVMSPIFKLDSYDRTMIFKINATINIEHNEYEASGLNYYDYCLAKLDNFNMDIDIPNQGAKWVCVERQTTEGQTQFGINEFGVYAVILNPLRDKINYFGNSKAKNFFLENVKFILIVLAVVIVVVALVFYIFLRVSRYRQKYHENRAKILLLQQQKQEYENMTTDIFGQTLGDNINGIVYKSNPAYTVSNEIKKSGSSLEEDIEKLQIECRNVDDQNERLQKDIADITEKYKTLSATIENMNK
jgi:methyl-accepting chemotaxis protein